MAIYHLSVSSVQRSGGGNAIATAAYVSGSKLTYQGNDWVTGKEVEKTWDYRSKDGVAYSSILAPIGAEEWVYDRQVLWNRAEKADRYKNSNPAHKIIGALPIELTLEQNIEFVEDFIREALVSKGMIVDYSLHYDNLKNPHVHMMMTTRELDKDSSTGFAKKKEAAWAKLPWIHETRKAWADIQNKHLEMQGFDVRVSHLSYKALGITDLKPGKHEGPARHIKDSELRANNLKILGENAAAIVANPELVFDKISINKPVFTKEDIAIYLSEALAINMDLPEQGGDETLNFKEAGKSLVVASNLDKNLQENNNSKVQENNLNKDLENTDNNNVNNNNSSSFEGINSDFSGKFLSLYSTLLTSPKIELLNPCDLRGRTLYALAKRLDLERRYTATVEELGSLENHNLAITTEEILEQKPEDGILSYLKEAGRLIEDRINDVTELNLKYFTAHERKLSDEQLRAVHEIVNGKDLSVLEGFPGSGKTFALKEVVRLYEKRGYKVIGTAKSSVASQVLESETGIACMNTTLLRKSLLKSRADITQVNSFKAFLPTDYFKEDTYSKLCNEGLASPALSSKTVLLIDEAGMIDAPDMDYLLSEAKAVGAKVVLVGDNNQLTAVGITGAFKKAKEILGSSSLTCVQRHRNNNEHIQALQRKATELVGEFKIADAIGIYQKLGYLNILDNSLKAHEAIVKNYVFDYIQTSNALKADNLAAIRSIAVGAYSNEACTGLNKTIRSELLKAGILKGIPQTIRNGSNKVIELAIGEQIVFTANKTKYNGYGGVLNGELGTIISIKSTIDEKNSLDKSSIITALVHKADGSKKVVRINSMDKNPITMEYGYAITAHKLQGETVDNMKVLFEPSMGYEAFNVLMSRYKYDMKFFAAKDALEKIVWDRTGSDTELLKETNALESYYYRVTGDQTFKVPIPNWLIGLNLAASKRANNNFALNYKAKDCLTTNELAIKEYLEAREAVFGLETKIRVWREQIAAPKKLTKLYAKIADQNPELFKSPKEITIDPYALIYGRCEGSKENEENRVIWQNIAWHDKKELKHLFDHLKEAKATREETAKILIEHYQAWVGDETNRQVSMGDRIIQYNLNYSTIEKHANLSPMRHYLKALKDVKTIAISENYKTIMDVIYNITTGSGAGALSEEVAGKISRALDLIGNEIQTTKVSIAQTKEELAALESTFENLSKEQRDIDTFSNQLLPEFLSRIYRAPSQEIIKGWNKLVEAKGLEISLETINDDPMNLGSFKGIGFGNFFSLTKKREDALANLNQIADRFKAYEEGKTRMIEISKEIEEQDYPKAISELQKSLTASKNSLPNKYEEAFLLKLTNLKAENDLNLKSLTELSDHDDVRGLIYEYYNMLNDNHSSKGSTGKVPAEKDTISDSTKIKEVLKDYRYKPPAAPKLDFTEVSKQLTETDYKAIFEKYAHLINEDGGSIKERAHELSLGSLSMNVQKGLWTRHSTNEGGNIYSFIEKATNCTKYEALLEVAKLTGIVPEKAGEFVLSKNNKPEAVKPETTSAAENKEPKNEWIAKDTVPSNAPAFDPKTHLAGLLEHNSLGGIYPYHSAEGKLLGYTVRLISKLDQTKQVMPVAYCQNQYLNKEGWRLKGFTDKGNKPIYGIEKLKIDNQNINNQNIEKPILIVEGEKTADIAQKLFPEHNVLSWLGGSASAGKANWEVLAGRDVVIFPDNDTPGIKSSNQIAQIINRSNGYLGKVTIVDPTLLTFQGKTHTNILPHKWDLGDDLPKNLTIDNIKEAIELQKEQRALLEASSYLKDRNEHKAHESTLEQRIYWQSKLAGALIFDDQIISLATRETEISTKLSSSEAKHYMNVSEIRGQNECSHECLKYDHPLYQATLSAVAIANESSKGAAQLELGYDKLGANLPNLINNIQSKYEQKANYYLPYKTTQEKETFEAAKKAIELSHEGSASKAKMFEVLTKDILMLQSLQLQNLGLNKIPTYMNLYQDTIEQIKEIILSYKASNGRGTDPNKLEDKDRADIANIAYNKLCAPNYYKAQITKHLEEVSNFQSKLSQVKQFAPNEASILSQMPSKYSLSDSIKAADRRIEENRIDKEVEYRSFVKWNQEKLEGIKELDPKYDLNQLNQKLQSLSHNRDAMTKHLDTEYGKVFKEKSLPILQEIKLQKSLSKTPAEFMKALEKERDYCVDVGFKHFGAIESSIPEEDRSQVYTWRSYHNDIPNFLSDLSKVVSDITQAKIWSAEKTLYELKEASSYDSFHREALYKCKDHFNYETTKDLRTLEALGKVESGNKTFTSAKDYLEHQLGDPVTGYYLKDTHHHRELTKIHAYEQVDYIAKNFKDIGAGKVVSIQDHKFSSQANYLKYEIDSRQDNAQNKIVIKVLKDRLEDLENHIAVEALMNRFEEHEAHLHENHLAQPNKSQTQAKTQKILEKTKDDDFTFNM